MSTQPPAYRAASERITKPYLLVILIPVHVDAGGHRWLDPLWYKDLLLHLDYIDDLTLACPRVDGPPPMNAVLVTDPRIRFVDLPSRRKATINLMPLISTLWQAIGHASVVHSAVGNWNPLSVEMITAVMAPLRKKFFMIIVESAPWRLLPGAHHSLGQRVKARLAEGLNRWCLSRVDLGIFTHSRYLESLMTERRERGHVIHASWIDEPNILSDDDFATSWRAKGPDTSKRTKLLFAGRLNEAKGLPVLLDALELLEGQGTPVDVDIIGSGDLHELCQRASNKERLHVRLRLLPQVAYGEPFFQVLKQYHAILVPSISDEQPRVVYDAFSQGVPVIASDTAGLRDCVTNEVDGCLAKAGDASALATVITQAVGSREALMSMGLAGLSKARTLTHQGMHLHRLRLLQKAMHEKAG